jgi:hypothetical protein
MLIGMDAIPPRGGNSGGAIQDLYGCGAMSYRESPPFIGIIVVCGVAVGGIIMVGASLRDLVKNIAYRKNKSATERIIKIVVPRPPEIQNTPGGHLLRPDLPRAILT